MSIYRGNSQVSLLSCIVFYVCLCVKFKVETHTNKLNHTNIFFFYFICHADFSCSKKVFSSIKINCTFMNVHIPYANLVNVQLLNEYQCGQAL